MNRDDGEPELPTLQFDQRMLIGNTRRANLWPITLIQE